jgi:hypothetical protein
MECARDHVMGWSLALGGSTTGIEASSNGAVLGIAERNRQPLSFWQSTRYGLLVTAATVTSRTHITARDQKILLSSPVREGVADPPDVGQGLGGVLANAAHRGVGGEGSEQGGSLFGVPGQSVQDPSGFHAVEGFQRWKGSIWVLAVKRVSTSAARP